MTGVMLRHRSGLLIWVRGARPWSARSCYINSDSAPRQLQQEPPAQQLHRRTRRVQAGIHNSRPTASLLGRLTTGIDSPTFCRTRWRHSVTTEDVFWSAVSRGCCYRSLLPCYYILHERQPSFRHCNSKSQPVAAVIVNSPVAPLHLPGRVIQIAFLNANAVWSSRSIGANCWHASERSAPFFVVGFISLWPIWVICLVACRVVFQKLKLFTPDIFREVSANSNCH